MPNKNGANVLEAADCLDDVDLIEKYAAQDYGPSFPDCDDG
jgi:hypothetical protein